MASVHSGEEILPKGLTPQRYRRQTDRQTTDDRQTERQTTDGIATAKTRT